MDGELVRVRDLVTRGARCQIRYGNQWVWFKDWKMDRQGRVMAFCERDSRHVTWVINQFVRVKNSVN